MAMLDQDILYGAALCFIGCLTASLASPLDASVIPTAVTTKNVPKHCQVPPPGGWGAKLTLVATTGLEDH